MIQQQLAGSRGEKPLGMFAQTGDIWKREGIRGLYRGFSAAALREATYSSLRFGLYEPLKVALDSSEGTEELPVYKKVAAVGPGGYCSSRHKVTFTSRDEGSKCVG